MQEIPCQSAYQGGMLSDRISISFVSWERRSRAVLLMVLLGYVGVICALTIILLCLVPSHLSFQQTIDE